ncbi:MBL fold metallo-hydrolase RNA specificity domain-containing protein [Desulforamulus aeronauticus]|uniref:Metallo-beta-lactamase family protein n=1 Tax=Desulforamulus aeronauticus DSM 10349 TaxID=1121421 RepID=A0A1M6PPS0_9FIRM|nr:MBL fold metallo-hydrolase [Desulforamulus aeronauticus]SHK09838.1 metallo-beta-lactamase family protein [Desulforamulus aeronauticus DSM 10349]
MYIQFLGAAETVTGSCFLVDTGSTRVMVDCGLFQGSKEIKERNYRNFPISPGSVDFVVLTHAHIDHSGLLPKFIKQGFKGKVITTSATVDLCEILLPDCGHIQEMEVERKNRKYRRQGRKLIEPIYTADDGAYALKFFERVDYDTTVSVGSDVRVCFRDAGHILGSSMVEMWVRENGQETKLVFSGDIGNTGQPYLKDPSVIAEADYVIMESTYGNREHQDLDNKLELLQQAIVDTYNKGGKLIIPAFAAGRTQDVLYSINVLKMKKAIPEMPIYIDSPMAINATEIFKKNCNLYDEETKELISKGCNPLEMSNIRTTLTMEASRELNFMNGRAIIISASGMCDAGRIKHHLRHNLWRSDSTILFVGYQAEGTLGRRILSGEKTVRIHGEEVVVKAEIRRIDGYSAHADQTALLNWVKQFSNKLKKVFVVHGEAKAAANLESLIKAEGIEASVPYWLEKIELAKVQQAVPEVLLETWGNIQKRMQGMLQGELSPTKYSVLLRQLAELEAQMNQVLPEEKTQSNVS